jgi:hypothetical protein
MATRNSCFVLAATAISTANAWNASDHWLAQFLSSTEHLLISLYYIVQKTVKFQLLCVTMAQAWSRLALLGMMLPEPCFLPSLDGQGIKE